MFFCSVLIRYLSQVFYFQSLCSRPILNYLRSFWVYSYLLSVHPPQLNISVRNVLLLLKIPLGKSGDTKLSSTRNNFPVCAGQVVWSNLFLLNTTLLQILLFPYSLCKTSTFTTLSLYLQDTHCLPYVYVHFSLTTWMLNQVISIS